MDYLAYSILIIFAFLPSFIWLLFFLRKDIHPESKEMILKIFLYGVLIPIPTIFISKGFQELVHYTTKIFPPFIILFLEVFIGTALIEEFMKYLVFREKVSPSAEFDEPIDAIIYMIIIALGFAAFENFLVLLGLDFLSLSLFLKNAFLLSLFRFVSAIFLHALTSGIFGYFLALSSIKQKNKGILLIKGLTLATLLHGFYNLAINKISEFSKNKDNFENVDLLILSFFILLLFSILIGGSLFINFALKKLKESKNNLKNYE
jgi:RsiW-degrading membrane proteinase PrsW (M82 family)